MVAPGSRRPSHATAACDQCFRLKVRCDGSSPSCASCCRLGQKCTYFRPDRRKLSKFAVTQLLDRIRLLEATLNDHNIPIPSSSTPQATPKPPTAHDTRPKTPELVESANDVTNSVPVENTDNHPWDTSDRERALIERIDQRHKLAPGLDPDMEILVKRTGSLQLTEQGQLKYFGTTSNVHFLQTEIPFQSPFNGAQYHEMSDMWLERTGLGHFVPREVEDHLIKLYFTWQNPYFHVVDQKAFMDARRQAISDREAGRIPKSSCYSELLVNTMCSWGALFTDREALQISVPLHDLFILRSRALLDRDIDNPTIATVQALAMMSGSEASKGRDSRGWLYDSMAAQLAHHLGLHLDVEHYVQSNDISRQEANARSTAFWGTYIINTAWSYYLGRLCIPISGASRIPVRKPTTSHSNPPLYWENYTDQNMFGLTQYPEPLPAMWEHQIRLCYIMERLQKAFYDKKTGSISQLRSHTSSVTSALDSWLFDLPPELSVDISDTSTTYLPHVLVLHAQFQEAMIFANHPFITSSEHNTSADSRRRYLDAARATTRIVETYKRLWTLRRMNIQGIHPMFTAAMVHLYIACTSKGPEEFDLAISDLGICCAAMKDISKAFDLAAWQLRSLHRVCQIWYEMLEDQSGQSSAEILGQVGPTERWKAIHRVIEGSLVWTAFDPAVEEQNPWFSSWMEIQEMAGVDPFSFGSA